MSLSRSASIRLQSVLDRFFVFFPFFMICLSQRDDANGILRELSERDKGYPPPNHANPKPSLLAIILTRVGANQKHAAEHFFRLREVEPMLPDIGAVLGFVPLKSHCNSNCSYRQSTYDSLAGRMLKDEILPRPEFSATKQALRGAKSQLLTANCVH